jgi:hypothetical protein
VAALDAGHQPLHGRPRSASPSDVGAAGHGGMMRRSSAGVRPASANDQPTARPALPCGSR